MDRIDAALSFGIDVTTAEILKSSKSSKACYQGQTHGHPGFLLPRTEAEQVLVRNPVAREVLHPYLTADEMLGEEGGEPTRYVIDFGERNQLDAAEFKELFARVERNVLQSRQERADKEATRNTAAIADDPDGAVGIDHAAALAKWWTLFRRRGELLKLLNAIPRYIACARVTKRPIFAFVSSAIHPNDALAVFPLPDDYSFAVLQSSLHWEWFKARSSTMKGDWRYTSNSVFDTFAWPQEPTAAQAVAVASAAREVRAVRTELQVRHHLSLRDLYRALDRPGSHPCATHKSRRTKRWTLLWPPVDATG